MQLFLVLLKAVFNQFLLHVANLSGHRCPDGLVFRPGDRRMTQVRLLVFLIDTRWGLSLASRSDTQLRLNNKVFFGETELRTGRDG